MMMVKRGRGRPKGSKNKPRPEAILNNLQIVTETAPDPLADLTDDQVLEMIRTRFGHMLTITQGMIDQIHRAVIVSGAPGVGKTYTIEGLLADAALKGKIKYYHLRGGVSPIHLYKLLWEHRERGQILLIDDGDSVFFDEDSSNLMKAALDTSEKRIIGWRSEASMLKNEDIPPVFEYKGSIIFISNIDFWSYTKVDKKSKVSEHLRALLSRTLYLDLAIHNRRQLVLWSEYVTRKYKILEGMGLNRYQAESVLTFVKTHVKDFRTIDIRTIKLIGSLRLIDGDWEKMSEDMFLKPITERS